MFVTLFDNDGVSREYGWYDDDTEISPIPTKEHRVILLDDGDLRICKSLVMRR